MNQALSPSSGSRSRQRRQRIDRCHGLGFLYAPRQTRCRTRIIRTRMAAMVALAQQEHELVLARLAAAAFRELHQKRVLSTPGTSALPVLPPAETDSSVSKAKSPDAHRYGAAMAVGRCLSKSGTISLANRTMQTQAKRGASWQGQGDKSWAWRESCDFAPTNHPGRARNCACGHVFSALPQNKRQYTESHRPSSGFIVFAGARRSAPR